MSTTTPTEGTAPEGTAPDGATLDRATPDGGGRPDRPLSTPAAAWLVAEREIWARLRTKSFLVSTGILLLLVLGSIIAGSIFSASAEPPKVAIVGSPTIDGRPVSALEGIDTSAADDRADAERMLRDGDVEAAVIPDDSTIGFSILAESESLSDLVSALSVSPEVQLLDPDAEDPGLRYLVALGFGLVFFMGAMTFGATIAQSVVEEKQTRIIEILVAAVPPRAMLAGKVVGTSILAFGQIALLLAAAIIGLTVTGQSALLQGLGGPIVWFAVFFVIGFVLLAALFAATGAMVSRLEDVGATTTPVTMLVMMPYFLVIFFNDNPLVVTVMSYVPFSAPVGMPLRLYLGDAQWWEPLLSLGILAVATLVVIALGARIYEASLLKLGARVPWREALKR